MSLYTVKALDDLTIFTTTQRKSSPFSATWSTTEEQLERELRHLRAHDAVLEIAGISPRDVRKDGTLRVDARPAHPGVRLSFQTRDHGEMSFTCDTYAVFVDAWKDNVRAIVLTLEALRAVERYGATQGQQYAGFAALPPGAGATAMGGMTRDQALEVLGKHGTSLDPIPAEYVNTAPDSLRSMWRRARKYTHPDRNGGDHTAWDQVEQAARVLGLDR